MYSGKEPQGQSEIPEGHCIKEGKLFHSLDTVMKKIITVFILFITLTR